ncbi:MAG: hypothetical protein ACXVEF_02610 [Polyangiales bacterium]
MSRAYRIRVSESIERIVHVEDGVATSLEILPILPKERMQELLAKELEGAGLTVKDGVAQKTASSPQGDVTIEVEVATGKVTVRVAHAEDVRVEADRERRVENVEAGEKKLREETRAALEKEVERATEQARREATARLEQELREARVELDRVVHRVTAAALKEKAAQLGDVEEVSEDENAGVLTIRVRV